MDKFRLFEDGELDEIDEVGFAKVVTIEEIAKNGYVLTPGRYARVRLDLDDESFDEKMRVYSEELSKLLKEEEELAEKARGVFEALGYRLEV
ncbi:N-6 DNA methylase [Archaeoglobus sulfaticallidus]|uniref:N-6 DNA methylase n=1 Tax=Archaeoglobus sulfaticallidus TaxID=1316941 RepID=UPI000694A6EE|nr:N-6 DNA methylase [Archaeoglobus sulfaticallidus]